MFFLVAGCASAPPDRLELMPAPAVLQEGKIDPFERLDPASREIESDILYATDRDPGGAGDAERYYANRRGYLVRLSRADISHGDGRFTWEEARRISPAREREEPYPLRVGAVEEIGILPGSASPFTDPALLPEDSEEAAAEFAASINQTLARSASRDIVVYVHGYKVHFSPTPPQPLVGLGSESYASKVSRASKRWNYRQASLAAWPVTARAPPAA
jgi:esterase/lipase superfamily enzyme